MYEHEPLAHGLSRPDPRVTIDRGFPRARFPYGVESDQSAGTAHQHPAKLDWPARSTRVAVSADGPDLKEVVVNVHIRALAPSEQRS